ncbi:MAG: D-alanine--D-alanine ligase [Bacteroidales bacterium]|nr:D-alanine--D-alanine ligase [Bacteroidales bacterium]
MIKKVAVIYGSDSSEWEVSCRSGQFTASQIDKKLFDVYEIFARFGRWELVSCTEDGGERFEFAERPQICKDDFSVCIGDRKVKFDYAYIMQHGTPGEDGKMQGYLEMLGVPFSSCNAFVSAITFDKFSCKSYLKDVDFVKCAKDIFIRKHELTPDLPRQVVEKLGLPVFVKPTDSGSSFGVTKVKKIEDFDEAVKLAFSEGKTMLIEESISGRELQCGVYRQADGSVMALPVIEIVSENEFFDYDAKYNGKSQEICPARITEEERELIQDASRKIYGRLDCSGVVRIDFILSEAGLYFLEINGIPGMTSASLVPQMVRTAGLSMPDFLTDIITVTSAK